MRNGAAEYHMNQYAIARRRYVRGVNRLKELERAAYAVGGTDYSRLQAHRPTGHRLQAHRLQAHRLQATGLQAEQ